MTTWRRITAATAEHQLLAALRTNRKTRNRDGRFIVEGVRGMASAVEHRWSVDAAVTHTACRLSDWAVDLVARAGPPVALELDPGLFDALTDRAERPELLLVVHKRPVDLDGIRVGEGFLGVVMDRAGSPGNLGTILRTADAMGASALVVSGHGADLHDPRTVRASAGSLFVLPTAAAGGPPDVARWLDAAEVRPTVVVADEGGDAVVGDVALERPLLLVLGNETTGPSRAYRDLADLTVSIPMTGSASSLNVAEAAAVLLYEIDRQRRARR